MTDLIESKPDIDALLNAGTYQNMSDAEIDALIAYRVECAKREASIDAATQAHDAIMRKLMDAQADAQAKAERSMRAALETQAVYRRVDA